MVGESDGTVEVCVNMTDPPLTAGFMRTGNIVLGIQSANGSAGEYIYVQETSKTRHKNIKSTVFVHFVHAIRYFESSILATSDCTLRSDS